MPSGPQGYQGYYFGAQGQTGMSGGLGQTGASFGDFTGAQAEIQAGLQVEKLGLKSGDTLIVHLNSSFISDPQTSNIVKAFQRINQRLKDRGIDLVDIVIFKENVKLSVISQNEEKQEFRRIVLGDG